MTKTLKQIQQENRRFILEGREYIAPKNIYIYFGKPITLSRVLLALPKVNKENKILDFLIGERGWEEIGGEWFDEYKKCFIARVETIANCDCCEDFWTDVFIWNLALGEIEITLEEQTEKTQRKINELFNNK